MGQKIHPVGLRLGITRTWDSRWYEKKNYRAWLHEDAAIRKYFGRLTRAASISKVEIERRANQARVIVHTAKPGIIIGKRGVGIEDIRRGLEHLTQKAVQVNVVEIKHPELDARLVGQNIVDQLEKRIAFRRAMKQAIMRTMKAGGRGVKVMVSGRLGGAEIARSEQNHDGKVPLHTLRADIDYAHVEAFTTFGRIGVKVWIYKGEVLPEGTTRPESRGERGGDRSGFRERRGGERRPRRQHPADERPSETPAEALPLPTPAEIEHDHASLASEIEGAPGIEGAHATGPHGGDAIHDPNAQHGSGVTAETSQVDLASQGTVDEAERPGAESTAPTAQHTEPSPQTESFERVHEAPAESEIARSNDVTLSEAPAADVTLSEAREATVILSEARSAESQDEAQPEAPSEEPT
jgi:small subunit ribosomal protein S3